MLLIAHLLHFHYRLGDPINLRFYESQERPIVISEFNNAVETVKKFLNKNGIDENYFHLNDDESKDSDMINNLNAIINEDDGDKEGGGRKEDEGEDKDDDDYTSKGLDDGEDEEAEEDVKMEIELDTDLPEYFVSRLDFADRRTSLMSREEYISYEKV